MIGLTDGLMQPGPADRSQAAPTAAVAVHVPGVVVSPRHLPPFVHDAPSSFTVPQGCPAPTSWRATHCLLCELQLSPCVESQPPPDGLHVVPNVSALRSQVPETLALAPSQALPDTQG